MAVTISWGSLQTLLLLFGPWLVPRILAFYRSIRNRPAPQVRPLPHKTRYALGVLFLSGLTAFLSTLPYFAPENIFRVTQSRLQTSAGVLLTRLAAVRELTPADERLREIFDSDRLDARLRYAQYGPHILLENTLAKPGDLDSSRPFLIYALPTLLAPHLYHLFALGVATSGVLSGKEGSRWRTLSIVSGLALAILEIYIIAKHDTRSNARTTRLNDVSFIHWKLQVIRGLAIAGTDALLGWIIWLQSTGRAFPSPPSSNERILDAAVALEKVWAKSKGLGVVRNAALRDAGMRKKAEEYWFKEGEVMKSVFEEPEVLEAQRNALKRLDAKSVSRDAESFVEQILGTETAAAAAATTTVVAAGQE